MEQEDLGIKMPMPEEAAPKKDPKAEVENKLSEIEELAVSMGWNPSFEGAEGKEKLSAKDYIKKGRDIQRDMSKRLKSQSDAIDEMKSSIQGIQDHYEKVSKAEIAKAKKELKDKRKEAIIDGDVDAVEKIDEEMDTLKEQEKTNKKEAKNKDKIFDDWISDNKWFEEDAEMVNYANYKLASELKRNPSLSTSEQLDFARKSVEDKFPEYFGKSKPEKKTPPTAVNEGGSRPGSGAKKEFTSADLSADQRAIMKTFVRQGIMTEKQYIADLVKIGEVK